MTLQGQSQTKYGGSYQIFNGIFFKKKQDLKNFYKLQEQAPMNLRVHTLKQQFKELAKLKNDQCVFLIQQYDKNLNVPHSINSPVFSIIGALFLYIFWLIFNAAPMINFANLNQ